MWLEELVEAAKAWSATRPVVITGADPDKHELNARHLAVRVVGYRQAIKDEVEAELDAEEKKEI